jgi:hypothetical protein
MSQSQRAAFRVSIALLTVSASLVMAVISGTHAGAFGDLAAGCTTCTGAFYGGNTTLTVAAIQHIWPQGNTNNCGVETAEAITNYADELARVSMRFTSTQNMFQVNRDNQNSSAASRWSYATPTNQWAGKSNIAPDAGTDPRSIAYMTFNYTPPNWYFHDYLYRWSFFHSTQPSFSTQALEATTSLAESLERWSMPTNTTINGGAHSVIVTGIWSGNDPNTHYPAQIQGLVFRDPEYAASSSRYEVDFATWSSTGLYMPPNNYRYSLWSLYYGDLGTRGDHKNTSDPEPTVGPYVPNAAKAEPYHWYDGFTWIQRDTFTSGSQGSPDWAFTAESPGNRGHQMTAP